MAGLLDAPMPEALASLLTAANFSVLFFPCFISIFSLEPIESCSTQSPFRNIECSEKPVKYFCFQRDWKVLHQQQRISLGKK